MNLGAHFIWIGDRTRQLDHAHVEYMRGVDNPIGLKVGPTTKPEELVEIIETLCPTIRDEPGKISLITRFGADKVRSLLPPLIKVVNDAGLNGKVIWVCDAMVSERFFLVFSWRVALKVGCSRRQLDSHFTLLL